LWEEVLIESLYKTNYIKTIRPRGLNGPGALLLSGLALHASLKNCDGLKILLSGVDMTIYYAIIILDIIVRSKPVVWTLHLKKVLKY
jgi:hypothetical protein